MEAVVGLIGGVVGAIIGAWCAVAFPRKASRRQLALQLFERYTSSEFILVRAETWRVRHTWTQGDRSCVQFFVRNPSAVSDPDIERRCANGLAPHQNLASLLNFFASLSIYHAAGLLDDHLLKVLFDPYYAWYRVFFQEFLAEYHVQSGVGTEPQPVWVTELPKLEAILSKRRGLVRRFFHLP